MNAPAWCVDPDEHGARGAICICPRPSYDGEAPRTGTGRALLSREPALKTTIIAIEREAASAECQAWMDEGYERPAAPPEPPLDVERRNTVERISDQWHALVNRSIAGELSHLEVIQHMNGLLDEATE